MSTTNFKNAIAASIANGDMIRRELVSDVLSFPQTCLTRFM